MPTARINLDTRYQHADDLYPVKIRVGHDRKARYFNVQWEGFQVRMSKADFKRATSARPVGEALEWSRRFKGFEIKAEKIIRDICKNGSFSFKEFKDRWSHKIGDRGNVFWWYDRMIEKHAGSPGTIEKYVYSRRSLQVYCDCKELAFDHVTPAWLRKYEKWMAAKSKSTSTVSIHLRHLRAVFNLAKAENATEHYPFGKYLYEIPKSKSAKRALTADQLMLLYAFQGEGLDQFARDFFILSYLLAGLNMADIFRIRWEDIEGDTLTMKRTKTGQMLTLHIPPDAWEIIRRHAQQRNIAGYIFPYLKDRMSEKQKRDEVKRLTRNINAHLQTITNNLGIKGKVTTYWARHTFATVAKGLGLPVAWIKEALSHSSVQVTENYLSNFEAEKRKEFTDKIRIWK